MSHRTHSVLLYASVASAIAAIVLSMAATVVYASHAAAARRAEQIAGCERANLQRLYINKIIEHHPEFALPPIPIPDCRKIIK